MQNVIEKQQKANPQNILSIQKHKYYRRAKCSRRNIMDGLVGESPIFKNVLAEIEHVAKTDAAVLLTGETGVGKNLVARAIHNNSTRWDVDFITVQCSTLTESLITSELFGHEKGAFTGATNRQIGRFEMADGGTIFLDEIGELSSATQALLLRVLQSREFERVGGGKEILKSNFRLITATNRDLQCEIKSKRFREDLFYRINVFPIHIPPLRERWEDIPILAKLFMFRYSKQYGKFFDEIHPEVIDRLIQHDWPGNIRELENIIQRSVLISREPHFQLAPLRIGEHSSLASKEFPSLTDIEIQHIQEALRRTGGKIHGSSGAAELLKVNPSTLTSRIKKLGIKKTAYKLRTV
jgi:formate hydrogenlyase transcriptional activator